jgi:VIT1/CCC1 family predicted Fe2+/Mn2+ transporter
LQQLVEDHLGDTLVDSLEDEDRKQIYQILEKKIPQVDLGSVSIRDDLLTVLIAFGLVVGSSVIVMIPFLFVDPLLTAIVVSNITGIVLLFFMGYWREESAKISRKLVTGGITALIALIITVVTVALGG